MFISDFAIKRPIVTVVSMVALVVFGVFSMAQLQTDEFPDVAEPIINVASPYPGAAPDVVEREVLDRVEEAISGISGVDRINGSAQDGFANITVAFVFEKDIQQASQDIRDKISSVRDQLPPEIKEPVLSRFDPGDQPIVQLSLNSTTLDAPSLTRIADPGITKELRGIAGVAEALMTAGLFGYLRRNEPGLVGLAKDATPKTPRSLWGGLALLMLLAPLGILAGGAAWGEWA